MKKKKLIDLREGDTVYWISMVECELNDMVSIVRELQVNSTIRSTDGFNVSVRTVGGTFFAGRNDDTCVTTQDNVQDEINLSFDVYATTKEEAVEKAQEFIASKLRLLGLIKRRLNEAETGLILADATLDQVDLTEEPSLEEFASMALC